MLTRGLCRLAFLVLPHVVLGVAKSADAQLTHAGQLSAATLHEKPTTLRGGHPSLAQVSPPHHHHHLVALQASQKTHLKSGVASGVTRSKSRLARRARRSLARRMIHAQDKMNRRERKGVQKLAACRGLKLKWWIKIKKKCTKAYGADSKWDRNRLKGKCSDAWNSCNTGFYAVCCTQPLGPKNMQAYCEKQNMTEGANHSGADKACEVQGSVADVQGTVQGIKEAIKDMDEEVVEEGGIQGVLIIGGGGPSPGPAEPVREIAEAPPGIMGAAPAPASAGAVIVGPTEHKPTPSKLEQKCEKLTRMTQEAAAKIHRIRQWAEKDGIKEDQLVKAELKKAKRRTGPQAFEDEVDESIETANPENPEAKDPDLVFSLKGVLKMGDRLQVLIDEGKFCSKGAEDDDDDDDPVEEDLKKDPTEDWVSDDEEEEEEDDDTEPALKVNETALMGLLEWQTELDGAVNNFETGVHPHGYKWWRYRYEYTVIESVVLAFSVMLQYLLMYLFHRMSGHASNRYYKTGRLGRYYRYPWVYLVFHAAAICFTTFTAYMLYIPWGKNNIFNLFAVAFNDWVDGRANVPFLGYSWLYMILDVQFQLFACYLLYSLFVAMVVHNYIAALRDWRSLSELSATELKSTTIGSSINNTLYKHLSSIVDKRVRSTPSLKTLFTVHHLRLPGGDVNPPLSALSAGENWHDFKLHLLLTEALGKSTECLVEVSFTTNICLCLSTLLVAVLAHTYQVAFMYFLPGFVACCFIAFVVGYALSRYFRMLSDTPEHKTPSKYVTIHTYCRTIQILLYCLFFSFARLLLSNDIYEFYPMIYICALFGLLVTMILLALFAGEVIKETCCALCLPPHIPEHILAHHLEEIGYWHTHFACHECGSRQMDDEKSHSKAWAGESRPKCSNPLCDAYFYDESRFCKKCGAPRPVFDSARSTDTSMFVVKSFRPT